MVVESRGLESHENWLTQSHSRLAFTGEVQALVDGTRTCGEFHHVNDALQNNCGGLMGDSWVFRIS